MRSSPAAASASRAAATSQRRLLAAQVSASLALPAGATAGGVIAVEIAGTSAAALPLALIVAGSGAAALTAGALTGRHGRRAVLAGAYAVALLGALLTVAAAVTDDLALLLVASALFGAGNAAAMLSRYAAADGAAPTERGRALSRMLLALTLGAVVVPNLLAPAATIAQALNLPGATGLFLLAAPALLAAAVLLPALPAAGAVVDEATTVPSHEVGTRAPRALRRDGPPKPPRWLRASAAAPLAVLAAANLAMVTVMAVIPPLMHSHGTSLTQLGILISAHVGAMYAPAALAGKATDRYGAHTTALVGTALMVFAAALGLTGQVTAHTGRAALVLLLIGMAWSTQVVAASSWLTNVLPQTAQARAEGIGEVGMALAATGGGLAAAPLLALGGTPLVLGVILVATLSVGLLTAGSKREGSRSPDAASSDRSTWRSQARHEPSAQRKSHPRR